MGKTTICKNVAYKLALDNKKVLLIDLDPQANLTMEFISDEQEIKKLIFDFKLETIILNTKLKESEIFKAMKNKFSSIWKKPYYWRQKQAYEELIKEIV